MVYKTADDEWVGVLNDYDLSSVQEDGPGGNERTGTIPFMALALLTTKAIKGEVEHLYQHDAELFIWVLTWVCLRYENGKVRSDRPLHAWLKEDANGYRKKKDDFLGGGCRKAQPSPSHQTNWGVVLPCLNHLHSMYGPLRKPALEDEYVYNTWLKAEVEPYL
jgi:hypothetical protein